MNNFSRLPVDVETFVFDPGQLCAIRSVSQYRTAKSSFTLNWVRYTIDKIFGGFTAVTAWLGQSTEVGRISFYSTFHDTVEVTGPKRRWIGTTLMQTKIAVDGLLPFETSSRLDKLALLTRFGYFPIAQETNFKSLHGNTTPLDDIVSLILADKLSDWMFLIGSGPYRLQYNPLMAQKFAELMGFSFDLQEVPQLKK